MTNQDGNWAMFGHPEHFVAIAEHRGAVRVWARLGSSEVGAVLPVLKARELGQALLDLADAIEAGGE